MISVIIPAYNAEKTIGECLEALHRQTFRDFETIIVDDGSSDGTVDVAKKSGAKVIVQDHAGPAVARNRGAKESRGDIILFTDSDCVPDSRWLENMLKPFADKSVAGVAGTYRTKNTESTVARFVGYEIELRHERMKRFASIDFVGTYSAAYRKDVFFKFGGFDTDFATSSAEDPEISFRMAKAGQKLVLSPDAFVCHPHPATITAYLKQKFQRGYWRVLLYGKHPEKMKGESYTPPTLLPETLFTGLALLSAPLLFSLWYVPAFFLILVALINLKFYAFMFGKEISTGLLSLPLVFLRNAAYGFGIVAGLAKALLH